jgi:hypothetical protein
MRRNGIEIPRSACDTDDVEEQEMISVHPQYVVDETQQRKAVLLTLEDWQRILEALEDLDDVQAYDEAKAGPQESVPFEQAVREIREGRDR